jgi:hypothetical protein
MNWQMAKKAAGGTLTVAGFFILFRPGGTQEMVIGVALLIAGAVMLLWAAQG